MTAVVRGWAELARLVRKSTDTVGRERKRAGDRTRPWWPNEAAALAWYAALQAALTPKPPPEPTRRSRSEGPIDPRKVVAELTR